MDPIHTCIALSPLAAYLLILAILNLRGQPTVISGGLDLLGVTLAVMGLVIVGPLDLFWPDAAGASYGVLVWFMLLGLYWLGAILFVLMMRPRLVIYNCQREGVLEALKSAAAELDPEARFAGDSLLLPQLGVQLHVEPFPPLRNVQLVSSGPRQSFPGWQALAQSLQKSLGSQRSGANPYAYSLLLFSAVLWTMVGYHLIASGPQVVASWWEALHQAKKARGR